MRKRLLALPVVIALAAAMTSTANAATAHQVATLDGRPAAVPSAGSSAVFDSRAHSAPLSSTKSETTAIASMVRAIGSGARVTYDPIFGTPRELLRNGGYLTGPSRGTPVSIARGWIAAHRAALGLTANDVRALTVTRDYANPSSGTHVITFTQMFGGLPAVFGGRLNVAVTRSGRILSFTGDARPSASLAAQPTLSISSAVAALAKSAAPRAAYRASVTGKSGIWTQFAPGPFGRPQYARAAAFPTAQGVRPAYEVVFTNSAGDMTDAAVDAVTGKILYSQSLTASYVDNSPNDSAATPPAASSNQQPSVISGTAAKTTGPEGLAFPYYPGAPAAPDQVTEPFTGTPLASPAGWLNPAVNGFFTTQGNNVDDHENWLATRPEANPFRPVSANGQFLFPFPFPFQNNWGRNACAGSSYEQDVAQATTNLFYALNHLFDAGLETQPIEGIYVTGNVQRGIRNYNYANSPLNYGDLGYDIVGNEVHADGEIWTATLWQLRQGLLAQYGTKAGEKRTALLITAALADTAPNPSMLDARDGILTANQDLYNGKDTELIWKTFASRGMGSTAGSIGSADPDPDPSFASPNTHDNGRLAITTVDPTGRTVTGVNVFIGDYEARVTPSAITAGRGGTASVNMVPGTYDVTLQAPGWGSRTITGIKITAGATTTQTVALQPNLASATNGATVTASSDDGKNPTTNLIDDTQSTSWGNTPTTTPQDQSGSVTVALSPTLDTASTTISSIELGAYPGIGLPRFGAVKDYTIEVSDDGTTWTTVSTGTVHTDPPRPVAPELNYQTITLAIPVHANFVRLDVTHTQGPVTELSVGELQIFAGTP
jgi:hypothetical protein